MIKFTPYQPIHYAISFTKGLTLPVFIVRLIRLLIPTLLNVALINYASSRAQAAGDADLFTAAILLVSLVASAAMFIEAIRKIRGAFNWDTTLFLVVCSFNLYYFFKVYTCCVPVVGSF